MEHMNIPQPHYAAQQQPWHPQQSSQPVWPAPQQWEPYAAPPVYHAPQQCAGCEHRSIQIAELEVRISKYEYLKRTLANYARDITQLKEMYQQQVQAVMALEARLHQPPREPASEPHANPYHFPYGQDQGALYDKPGI